MKPGGYTLMELMVTIAILSLLLALAAPAFVEMVRRNQLSSATNQLVASLNLARSEAVKRSARVAVCASANGRLCAGDGGFEQGWIVFVDGDGAVGDSETVVREYEALPDWIVAAGVKGDGGAVQSAFVAFDPDGTAKKFDTDEFLKGTIAVCGEAKGNCIKLEPAGRPSVADHNGCSCAVNDGGE